MKLKEIFTDVRTKVFVVTNQDDENELNWTIESTAFELLPEKENSYFVKAIQVSSDSTTDCFMGIVIPERIAETVIKRNAKGQTIIESIYDQERIEEAIEAFKISEEFGPSSKYTYWELSGLYGELGDTEKQAAYKQKYKDKGGVE